MQSLQARYLVGLLLNSPVLIYCLWKKSATARQLFGKWFSRRWHADICLLWKVLCAKLKARAIIWPFFRLFQMNLKHEVLGKASDWRKGNSFQFCGRNGTGPTFKPSRSKEHCTATFEQYVSHSPWAHSKILLFMHRMW